MATENQELNRDRIDRLRRALDSVTDFMVYPAAWEGKYEQRTDYMNGWNDCVMETLKRLVAAKIEPGDWDG